MWIWIRRIVSLVLYIALMVMFSYALVYWE